MDSREYTEENYDTIEKNLHVYTTHYGTQYVLPIDLILSQEEMRRYLKEVRQQVASGAVSITNGGHDADSDG